MLANRMMMGAAGAQVICTVSNGDYINEACAALGSWADNDAGNGVSTQIDNPLGGSKTTFKFDSGTTTGGDQARRSLDPGSIEGLGNKIVVSASVYLETIGTTAVTNGFSIIVQRSDISFNFFLLSDGVHINYGGGYTLVAAGLPAADIWQEWSFDITIPGGVVANAVVDTYLNNVRVAKGTDCTHLNVWTDGYCSLTQWGYSESNRIAYVDWFKVGSAFV